MKTLKSKKWVISLILFVGVFISGGTGFQTAMLDTHNANRVFHPGPEPVKLIEKAQLDFGIIQPPSSGSQDFEITPSGGLKQGVEGDGRFLRGQSTGSVLASGEQVQFDVTTVPLQGSCTVPGTDLTGVRIVPESGAPATRMRIGGHLTVQANAKGNGTCEYLLTANYN